MNKQTLFIGIKKKLLKRDLVRKVNHFNGTNAHVCTIQREQINMAS